jgi:anti-anti-sigma factor
MTVAHGLVPAPPPFRCDVSYAGDGAVVAVRGELDMENAPRMLSDVVAVLEHHVSSLTVDLARVTFVDSSGLAALVAAQHRARQRDVAFELTSVPDQTKRIFEITHLAELFGLADQP